MLSITLKLENTANYYLKDFVEFLNLFVPLDEILIAYNKENELGSISLNCQTMEVL